jgi:hypothetical protein
VIVGDAREIGQAVGIRLPADDEPRGALRDLILDVATETLDKRARFLSVERPQLSGEHNRLAIERHLVWEIERKHRHGRVQDGAERGGCQTTIER